MWEVFQELAEGGLLVAEAYFHHHKHLLTTSNVPLCRAGRLDRWSP